MVQFLVADRDVSSSAIRSSRTLVFTSATAPVPLRAAQPAEIQLAHLLGVHPLRRQRAQTPFQPRVNLLLHQRFRNRELERSHQRGEQPVLGLASTLRRLRLARCSRTRSSRSSKLS